VLRSVWDADTDETDDYSGPWVTVEEVRLQVPRKAPSRAWDGRSRCGRCGLPVWRPVGSYWLTDDGCRPCRLVDCRSWEAAACVDATGRIPVDVTPITPVTDTGLDG
jgi:hypothetical protein